MSGTRTHTCRRRRIIAALALGLGLSGPGLPRAVQAMQAAAPRETAASGTGAAQTALDEMARIEAQLDEAERSARESKTRLDQASQSMQTLESSLADKTTMGSESSRFFNSLENRAKENSDALATSLEQDRETISRARQALRLASAALYGDAAASPADAETMALLAVAQRNQRDRAQIATERALRKEADRDQLAQLHQHADSLDAAHTVFSDFTLAQLRARHDELAQRVAQLQSAAQQDSETVARLAERRKELNGLVQELAQREATNMAGAATPATARPLVVAEAQPASVSATPGLMAPPPNPTATLSPAAVLAAMTPLARTASDTEPVGPPVPPELAQAAKRPGVAGSAPPTAAAASDLVKDSESTTAGGTRRLFWRALPAQVMALAGGRVAFSGPFAGYRHLLIIDHGDGWRTLYGNLTRCTLAEGATVTGGQPLGEYQAMLGAVSEPLWFEVRQGVKAVAPSDWPALPKEWEKHLFAPPGAKAPTSAALPDPTPPTPYLQGGKRTAAAPSAARPSTTVSVSGARGGARPAAPRHP